MKKILCIIFLSVACHALAAEQASKTPPDAISDAGKPSPFQIILRGLFPDSPFEKNINDFFKKYLADYKNNLPENDENIATSLDNSALKVNNSPALRIEANHTKRGKAYTINGKRYVPFSKIHEFTQEGIASWYGPGFHGKKTANGERFNQNALTAAHKELPLNSLVKVTRISTGKSIIVRINDRGPFYKNRVIDLSYEAATQLGFKEQGFAKVKIELIPPEKEAPPKK